MDLAEIRKKAKTAPRTDEQEALPLGARPVPSVQGVPLAPVAEEPIASSEHDPPAHDPLEELFSLSSDLRLATEEVYLQGLAGEKQKEQEVFRQYLTFALGNEEYALDIANIREIIKPREITDIPRVPDFILGIISLRGIIIPVFDLKKRLKLGASEITAVSRIVVCQMEDRMVGLLVDSITQVVRLSEECVESPPAVLSGVDRDLVVGVGRHQGRMIILLHLSSIMDAQLI